MIMAKLQPMSDMPCRFKAKFTLTYVVSRIWAEFPERTPSGIFRTVSIFPAPWSLHLKCSIHLAMSNALFEFTRRCQMHFDVREPKNFDVHHSRRNPIHLAHPTGKNRTVHQFQEIQGHTWECDVNICKE